MELQKIRFGMIGGGQGALIGAAHRRALLLDGYGELVAGCLSTNLENNIKSAKEWFIDTERTYETYQEMLLKESVLDQSKRIHAVIIVTPNFLHFEMTKMALELGFNVVLDKPMCLTFDEAKILENLVKTTNLLLCLTHTYTGYPLIKETRARIKSGQIGKVRKVLVNYPQGWLSKNIENQNQKQALWRTDPKKSGKGGALGDIGTHAANLAEYISGANILEVCAKLNTFVQGRKLDDDVNAFLKMENNVQGVLTSTQIGTGESNFINYKIYGETGSFEWTHQNPNQLIYKDINNPWVLLEAGAGNTHLSKEALHNLRFPGGHPEGFLEAFANIYRNFSFCVMANLSNTKPNPLDTDFPNESDGVRGMAFIDAMIESNQKNQAWIKLKN